MDSPNVKSLSCTCLRGRRQRPGRALGFEALRMSCASDAPELALSNKSPWHLLFRQELFLTTNRCSDNSREVRGADTGYCRVILLFDASTMENPLISYWLRTPRLTAR